MRGYVNIQQSEPTAVITFGRGTKNCQILPMRQTNAGLSAEDFLKVAFQVYNNRVDDKGG